MLNIYKNLFNKNELLNGNFGLEREALRVDSNGYISFKEHPSVLGDKIDNPYITTDFSESQVEMITPALSTLAEARDFLEVLYDIVSNEIEDEYLWPQSMPCDIPLDGNIPVANFGDGEEGKNATEYRQNLLEKYGGKKQLISGIHYNFSFKENIIEKLYSNLGEGKSYKQFKNEFYLKIARNYLRYRWLLIYLLGGTPVLHESYSDKCLKILQRISHESYTSKGVISIRNSECGYENKIDLFPSYSSVESHVKSIINFIDKGVIENSKELYSQVRLKSKDNKNLIESLLRDGVQYLEIRSIDINPFEKSGISIEDLRFIHLFVIYLSIKEENNYDLWQEEGLFNQRAIAKYGQDKIELKRDGNLVDKNEYALEILSEIERINKELSLGENDNIERIRNKVLSSSLTYANKITEKTKEEGYIKANMSLAKAYKDSAYQNRFKMVGFEDMELSTQILMKESIKRGITVDILDRKENFISLSKGNKKEYIKQATETSMDSYSTVLMMENKVVTKKVLKEHGIRVPLGEEFDSLDDAISSVKRFINTPVVIKPKSTNFGIGISIFPDGTRASDLIKAFEIAFENDVTVLIEEFIKGKEFRFLVIGDEVAGVLNRVPANVIGNGTMNIEELVEEKNKSYLRGKGYKTPLEKIKLDKHVDLFLSQRGLDTKYIPKVDEIVYLRENSNISTGGDSIDYTDTMPQRFKDIAVASARAVDAKICGVDLMIEDYTDKNSPYAIIELNFNPAIHIHSFPYKGVERKIAEKVLRLLGFVK
ncbi:bifunctional glutamate--cysteine ligase GshA/glutathione synthetase GshB [Clostridium cylindrosporum]|uniref:Glutathione biosynthesis bifunctional protein GshAB n=1 Tax=Clostridium cylindrosporum DSM 605 TaxID=1121307 RepID=A0A0J8DAI3_CLOCY|nr:bifunctional glutamate--cysteine ligase GshA/glutathione synthetase GshB [Clostridium cylindrosporum]KMT23035.1 glutamate-cysteine ligase/glutathione synthase [Clostridium cylindrosporum DSM 605]